MPNRMEPIEVFVSSTYRDREWREAAVEAIRSVPGFRPLLVEEGAGLSIEQNVLGQLVKADIVVLVVGWLYGTVAPGRKESFVEMEYDVAAKSGKPIIALIQSDRLMRSVSQTDVEERRNLSRVMAFHDRLKRDRLVHTFNSADDLRMSLKSSLLQIEKERLGPTFSIAFDPELSEHEIRTAFQALSDYFRACGGVGLAAEFERQEVQVGDILHV
jgi:uncharacterized protein DUF4062